MKVSPLGEFVTITGGGTPSRKVPEYWNGNIPWITVKDFKGTHLNNSQESISDDGLKNSASNLIPAGTVIVPTRMALGKAAINMVDVAINQDLKALKINDATALDRDYLFRFLLSQEQYFVSRGKGATVKGITLDTLRELPLPLPPLDEQKRIAAILDKADAIRRKRQQAIELADQFLRSVFLDMFGDPALNIKGHEETLLGDVCQGKMNNGIFRINEGYGEGIPVAWVGELFQGNRIALDDSRMLVPTEKELANYSMRWGDILFCRSSLKLEGIGWNNVYLGPSDAGLFECHLIRMSPNLEAVDPSFLSYQLRMPNIRKRVFQQAKTVTMTTIDQGGVSRIKVMLPPLESQKQFSEVVEQLHNSNHIKAKSKEQAGNLFDTLSQQLFTTSTAA